MNAKLLRYFEHIIKSPYDNYGIDNFIDVIMEHGMFNAFVEKERKILVDTIYYFEVSKTYPDEKNRSFTTVEWQGLMMFFICDCS